LSIAKIYYDVIKYKNADENDARLARVMIMDSKAKVTW